jgi:VanZ family protein
MFEKYELRWPAVWISIAWLLIATIVYLSLARLDVAVPGAYTDKYGHVVAYGTAMLWFSQIYSEAGSRLVIAVALALLGVSLELAQAYVERSFEVADMVANAIGIVLGWLVAPPRTRNVLLEVEKWA